MLSAFVNGYTSLRLSLDRRVRKFQRDEDGALIIFGLMFLILMLMMGGLAVDLMHYEYTRTRLQNTLDRATLAAASLSQKIDPATVVRDYVLKAGLAEQLASVQVTQGLNERIVQATGRADTHPIFLPMMGINKLDAVGASAAQQAIDNLEIVLVLDVSGSMKGQKLTNLKIAATEFVDTMTANDPHHRVSIAIVPYNAQVNIGPVLAAKFNLTHRAGVTDVNCVEIPDTEFGAEALSLSAPMPMMAYADIAYATSKINGYVGPTDPNYAVPNYASAYCKPTTVNVVHLPSNDPAVLKAQINALEAGGNTSITLGMKWGAALLDPSLRATYTSFIANGDMPATLPGRPFDYKDKEARKYVVLMTDGEHVSHNRINDDYKTGASPIWKAPDGKYSVQYLAGRPGWAGTNTWYVPHLGKWQAAAYAGGGAAVQQDWKDVWASLKMTYVAWQFYARPLGSSAISPSNSVYNSTVNAMQSIYSGATATAAVADMDASLQTTCDQARANKVQIFGVTVEAPQHGNDVITACAKADHTFIADRLTIRSTFQKIAANITQLKLTQ
ncbi:MAG: pilus assembly protein TadG-related protein [Cypionkella sp.]